jgi:hypothetical protein
LETPASVATSAIRARLGFSNSILPAVLGRPGPAPAR